MHLQKRAREVQILFTPLPSPSLFFFTLQYPTCIPNNVEDCVVPHKVTGPKGKEVGGAGIVDQQLYHPRSHPTIPLVDQMIPVEKIISFPTSVVDPDQYWIHFQELPGSGSVFRTRIRIHTCKYRIKWRQKR